MSKESYSIPTGASPRFDYQRYTVETCTANAALWHISTERLIAIASLRMDYELKYAVTNNTSIQILAATTAREGDWALLETALIDLYDHDILNNDAIPAEGKDMLHIHNGATGGSVFTTTPTITPLVVLAAEEISILHVLFTNSAMSTSHSKLANVAFCEIINKVDAPAAALPAECPERANITRSHETVVFTPGQRGKTVSAFTRWVNRNGKFGP